MVEDGESAVGTVFLMHHQGVALLISLYVRCDLVMVNLPCVLAVLSGSALLKSKVVDLLA